MMKRYLMVAALALVMAGCGSNVKLDPPVQGSDATATGAAGGAGSQGAGQSTVTQVQAGSSAGDAAGPVGVERVIYFDYDSSEIRSEYVAVVAAHAGYLVKYPTARVRLEGHTDERGSREYNIGLGERRGQTVRRALLAQGVAESQLTTVSYGEERPAAEGADEAAYAQNRRVELVHAQ